MKTKPKFVTKLFAAIDGYAEIKAQSEQQALDLSRSAREIVEPIIEHHNGVWMYERDGKLYSNFVKPEHAVNCAVSIQQSLHDESNLKLRIGIHTGDVKSGIGTGDMVASGIAEMTVPGGVCVSAKVYASIQNKVAVTAEFLVEAKLNGIERPVRVYALFGEGLADPARTATADEQAAVTKSKPSIAVLPFVNMSADPEQEYFCDGISEVIIDALTHVEDLHVVARTSAFMFKDNREDIREIGKKLNVASILEGSVQKAGNRLRISAQLVNIADGYHLWSEKYDRNIEDIFAIQDEISLAIVEALKVKLLKKEKAAIVKRHTDNYEAHSLYLLGRHYWNFRTEEQMLKGLDYFRQAVDKDPDYALAYTGIADSYNTLAHHGFLYPYEAYPKAKEAVTKALEIDDMLSEAHAALGFIRLYFDWDWIETEREYKQAFDLNTNYAFTHHCYALYLSSMGRLDESIAESRRAQELDPLAPIITLILGMRYCDVHHYDAAM